MKIVGCDLHAKQQTIAMVDTDTGEFIERTLSHKRGCGTRVLRCLRGAGDCGHRSDRRKLLPPSPQQGSKSKCDNPAVDVATIVFTRFSCGFDEYIRELTRPTYRPTILDSM